MWKRLNIFKIIFTTVNRDEKFREKNKRILKNNQEFSYQLKTEKKGEKFEKSC